MSRSNGRRRGCSFNTPGHAHELTFSCYRGFPFLRAERTCRWLAEAIDAARARHAFDLWAFVFMPEHAHLLIRPRNPVYAIQAILSGIKLPVGRRAIQFLIDREFPWLERLTRRRAGRHERLFWQSGGGYDRNVVKGESLMRMIDYVHNNPVRRGLVTRARDWHWSSASWHEAGSSPLTIDPIPAEWITDLE